MMVYPGLQVHELQLQLCLKAPPPCTDRAQMLMQSLWRSGTPSPPRLSQLPQGVGQVTAPRDLPAL